MPRKLIPDLPLTADQQRLVEQYRGLACKLALYYWARWPSLHHRCEYDDFESAAQEGLCLAARRFDPAKAKFMTYAWAVVRDRLRKESQAHHAIHIPQNVLAVIYGGGPKAQRKTNLRHVEKARRVLTLKSLDKMSVHPHEATYEPGWHEDEAGVGPDVRDLLRFLDARDRKALRLHYLEGRSLRYVARQLGVSHERARQLVGRAVRRARRAAGVA